MSTAATFEITPENLRDLLRDIPSDVLIIDVREQWERDICKVQPSRHIPLQQLADELENIRQHVGRVVTLCHHGVRSLNAAVWLRGQGIHDVLSLRGGIAAWADTVEPMMARY